MKSPSLIAASIAVLSIGGPTAHADVIFDNFGPDDTYNLSAGATLAYGGPLGGEQHEAAVAFTVTGGSYTLDTAEVAILHSWGPDLVYATLHQDDDGRPGEIIEVVTGSGVTPPFEWAPPMVIEFSGASLLENGRQYWIALATDETDALLAWSQNVVDDFGLRGWRVDQGEWQTWEGIPERSVLRINATPVGGPALDIDGDCPGEITFTSTGNTSDGRVAFLYARATGSFTIPGGACAGTQLGLDNTVQIASIVTADDDGVARVTTGVPPAACGGVFVQTIDGASCATSNVGAL